MSAFPYPLWSKSDGAPALLASRETSSGEIVFPAFAPSSPLAPRHELIAIGGTRQSLASDQVPDVIGSVYSFTVIHPSPKSGQSPYALGYVDLPGPVRVFGRLQGRDRPVIGDAYRAVPDAGFGYVFEFAGAGEIR